MIEQCKDLLAPGFFLGIFLATALWWIVAAFLEWAARELTKRGDR